MTQSDRKQSKPKSLYRLLTVISLFVSVPLVVFFCILLFGVSGKPHDPDTVYTREVNYYAIEMGRFQTETEAKDFADRIRLRGGAGYTVKDKGYRVLVSVYKSKEACENVIGSLQKAKNECSLYTISLPHTALVDSLSDRQSFERAYELFFECVDALYEITVRLDTYSIEEQDACEQLLSLAKDLDPSFLKSDMVSIKCKAELTALSSLLQATANNPPGNLSVSLKYTEFQILYNLKSMLAEIKK